MLTADTLGTSKYLFFMHKFVYTLLETENDDVYLHFRKINQVSLGRS